MPQFRHRNCRRPGPRQAPANREAHASGRLALLGGLCMTFYVNAHLYAGRRSGKGRTEPSEVDIANGRSCHLTKSRPPISTFRSSVNRRRAPSARRCSRTWSAGGSTSRRTARGWAARGAAAGTRAAGPGPPLGIRRSRPRTRRTAARPSGHPRERRLGNGARRAILLRGAVG
jgi:hypothetical protein